MQDFCILMMVYSFLNIVFQKNRRLPGLRSVCEVGQVFKCICIQLSNVTTYIQFPRYLIHSHILCVFIYTCDICFLPLFVIRFNRGLICLIYLPTPSKNKQKNLFWYLHVCFQIHQLLLVSLLIPSAFFYSLYYFCNFLD